MSSYSAIKAIKKKRSAEQLAIGNSLLGGNKRVKFGATQPGLCDNNKAGLAKEHTIDEATGPLNKLSNGLQQSIEAKSSSNENTSRVKTSTRSTKNLSEAKKIVAHHGDGDGGEDRDDEDSAPNSKNDGEICDKPDEQGPNLTARPLSNLREMIQHLLEASQKDGLKDLVEAGQHYIRVGTLCSGTDAPLHVLNLFGMLKNQNGDRVFTTINVFGCEIEPFKQGFLLRNSKPRLLFRDARDFASDGAQMA